MKYLINADDFGRTVYTNKAIAIGFEDGYLDRTTLMVNMASSDEAVALARQLGFAEKVGLHLNLTSGIPLTEDIKKIRAFCNENGSFNSRIFKSKRVRLFLFPHELFAVRKEIDAQIEKYLQYGLNLKHLDSHGHIHTFPSMMLLCLICMHRRGFHSIRISLNYSTKGPKAVLKAIENFIYNRFNNTHSKAKIYFDSIQEAIKSFETEKNNPGVYEVMVHPDYRNGVDLQIELRCKYPDLKIFNNYRINSDNKSEGRNVNE